jgi:hypothetical protein
MLKNGFTLALLLRVVVLLFGVFLVTLDTVIYQRSKITPEATIYIRNYAMHKHM